MNVRIKAVLKKWFRKNLSDMRVIIVHYHLNPGGVTQIIRSQVRSIKQANFYYEPLIFTGHCAGIEAYKQEGIEIITDPRLNYLQKEDFTWQSLQNQKNGIIQFFKEKVTQSDIIHFHNLNLGKNPLLTLVMYLLAKANYKVLNHCHDFAEDRPANWQFLKEIIHDYFEYDLKKVLYPDMPNYYYAVLNSYDKQRLEQYGIQQEKCYLLPNPVNMTDADDNAEKAKQDVCQKLNINPQKKIITYPVRVIRRKNIGELVLLSVLFAREIHFAVTQPPKNPEEVVHYEKWKKFCAEKNLSITFEAGEKADFIKLIKASHSCITTSYKEGFGMAFLEPWLLDTPIIGRNITFLTNDFKNSGMKFPVLYDQLMVEDNGRMQDFKDIDPGRQMEYIGLLIENKVNTKDIFRLNSFLFKINKPIDKQVIMDNKKIVQKNYSLTNFAQKLDEAYSRFTF